MENNTDNPIYTDLFEAIKSNDLATLNEILKTKIDLEQTDTDGCTPTQVAINYKNIEIAKALINAGAKFISFDEHTIDSTIYSRRLDVLNFLIEMGIDVNTKFRDNKNRTALIEAANIGDIDIVKKLVESGADVNAISNQNQFALNNAASQGWQEIYDYLAPLTSPELRYIAQKSLPTGLTYRKRKDDKLLNQLINAVVKRNPKAIIKAINDGVDIDAFDETGSTALFLAANWGCVDIVRFLIEAGADVNRGDEDDKETPLMIAAARTNLYGNKIYIGDNGHIEVMKLLIKAGANVNAKSSFGWTALMGAANAGSIEAVKLLLKSGANPKHRSADKDTALSRAKEAGYADVVKLLREAGA